MTRREELGQATSTGPSAPVVACLLSMLTSCYVLTDFEGLDGTTASSTAGATTATGGASTTTTTTGVTGSGGTSPSGGGSGASSGAAGTGGEGGGAVGSGGGPGGTGGAPMCPPPGVNYAGLVLNELAPLGVPADWMELRNNSSSTIPLCAVFITQKYDGIAPPGGGDRFTFGQLSIGPGQYLIIEQGTQGFPFGLSKDEPERITLFAPDNTVLDNTDYVADPVTQFQATETWARISDATGPFKRVASPTKGAENLDLGGGGAAAGAGSTGAN